MQFSASPRLQQPDAARRRHRLWEVPAVVVLASVVFGTGWWSGATYSDASRGERTGGEQVERLTAAQSHCVINDPAVSVVDGGRTLTVDGLGAEDPGGATTGTMNCILEQLKAPQAVREHMTATRALDGRQSDSWESYTASWSYHPNQGLDLIVQVISRS